VAITSDLLLPNTNYFSWKSHMEDVLKGKGLYQITLEKEQAPIDAEKKTNLDNKMTKHVD
jgi:hypothetical protein